jgi:MFS family permease
VALADPPDHRRHVDPRVPPTSVAHHEETLVTVTRGAAVGTPRWTVGRTAGLASAAFALAIVMLATTLPTPLYGLYRERFGFSELTITVIFATYAAGVIAALVLLGRLSDQVGRRPMLSAGLALAALSAVAFLVADRLDLLILGRILSGLSAGIFTGTATATLVDLAAPERRHGPRFWRRSRTWAGWGAARCSPGWCRNWPGRRCG